MLKKDKKVRFFTKKNEKTAIIMCIQDQKKK